MSAAAAPGVERASTRHIRRLRWVFGLVVGMMIVEFAAGALTNSLALLSDAGHMATDALGLGLALAAISVAERVSSGSHRTYGWYRLEILAAVANAVLLFGVAGYVLYEAWRRVGQPPEIATGPMLLVAVVGLGVNLAGWLLLREGAGESLNIEGASLEVLADLWGSMGVVAAALIVRYTRWIYADLVIAAAIGLFILPRALRLGREAFRILVQEAPPHLDLARIQGELEALPDVVDVHDLHVWTLTSSMDVASVHLMIPDDAQAHPVLDRARHLLSERFGIAHATLQVEPTSHLGCREIRW